MDHVNIQDFNYMWQGQKRDALSSEAALMPIDIRGPGNQRALLMIHGFASSPAVYRFMVPKLTGYDAIVCPKLPGHGSHIEAFAKTQAQDWCTAVETACESLLQQYEHVDVLGLSLGGLLACHIATQYPIHHLYLLAPALALHLHLTPTLWCAQALHACGLKRIPNRAGNIRAPEHAELTYNQMPLRSIIEILSLIKTFKLTSPITCPIDLFLGCFDEVVDVYKSAAYLMRSPNITTHWLKHSAHVLPLDADVEAIIACINAQHT